MKKTANTINKSDKESVRIMHRDFVNEIEELKRKNVHIKDPLHVNEVIHQIIQAGFNRLQIVSDFDLTITKQHENGKPHFSSFKMFACCPSITEEYLTTTDELQKKYFPIEFDPKISFEDKRKYMEEWYNLSQKVLHGLKVSSEEIDKVVEQLSPSLRDGTKEFLEVLRVQNVPILVFSAGLGDSVVSVLKHHNVLLPNVKVISNFLKYDESGTILGFKGPLIHVCNKNEVALKGTEYYDLILERDNVILLGDSLGDAGMAEGISHSSHVLKIGFLYQNVEANLPFYMDKFDIVLEDDQTMDIVRAVINQIC